MKMKNEMIGAGISALIIITFFYIYLGFSAVKATIFLSLIYIIPVYIIINRYEIEYLEKIIYSLIIGLGIIPTMVFFAGKYLKSNLVLSTIICVIILIAAGIIINYLKNGKRKSI